MTSRALPNSRLTALSFGIKTNGRFSLEQVAWLFLAILFEEGSWAERSRSER